MVSLKFYYNLLNPGCRSVMLLLKSESIAYQGYNLNPDKGEANFDLKRHNILGTLPFIEKGNFKLSESSAILKYLAQRYKLPSHWFPNNDNKKQAKINEYFSWHHLNTLLNTQMYYDHKINILPVDYHALNKWKQLTEETLDQLEFYWLPVLDRISNDTEEIAGIDRTNNGLKYTKDELSKTTNPNGTQINGHSNHHGATETTREINLAHLLIACQLTQTYVAGWDVITQERPTLVRFFANFKRRIAEIRRESAEAISEGRRSVGTDDFIDIEPNHKSDDKKEDSTANGGDIFYNVHKEALDLRNIWYQQGKISLEC